MLIKNSNYDVAITGGGLAGLTLALQLKRMKPGINVLVLEKRKENAPVAGHKVGESLSELGAYYLREVLDLKDYLNSGQLRKFGFRFFFSPEYAADITRRVEIGSKIFNPFPSHQVDRGHLENDLVQQSGDIGVEVVLGAKVSQVDLSANGHVIHFEKENTSYRTEARWIVDASGRSSILKRKLELEKDIGHNINAAWFRLDAEIDIDYWSEDLGWRHFVDAGRRRLATNHLMGEGYWVWIIPLIEGRTSIGIVADPRYHSFTSFNSFEKAMTWLEEHEPLAATMLDVHRTKLVDFKVMKNFAYDTKQFYSSDKWALAGEAGAFLDPLYSPGSDFIGLSNTWISDLILRDINGEDIALRTLLYDHAHKQLFRGWAALYQDMYPLFGKTQVMLMKIIWDWASYWAMPNVMFANNGYIDIDILKQYSSTKKSIGQRFAMLNDNMQQLFRSWGKYIMPDLSNHQQNVFDLDCLHRLQSEVGHKYNRNELMPKIEANMTLLEQIAAEIFRKVSNHVYGTSLNLKVDPYNMKLDDGKEGILNKSRNERSLQVVESIRNDIDKMWIIKLKMPENEIAR